MRPIVQGGLVRPLLSPEDDGLSMESLIHVIYASAASAEFTDGELAALLEQSRRSNGLIAVTGMLLYASGSFFQVLEGDASAVDALFAKIKLDRRHTNSVRIIREPIAKRVFGEWTMGYAAMSAGDIVSILGSNDFFGEKSCFAALDGGRAKKLLDAFAGGRWRILLRGSGRAAEHQSQRSEDLTAEMPYSHAFQPIVDAAARQTFAYEALIRGPNGEPAREVLRLIRPEDAHTFDRSTRLAAISLAARLGITGHLTVNVLPLGLRAREFGTDSTFVTADGFSFPVERVILEVTEGELIRDRADFSGLIDGYRRAGTKVAIDDFGAGYSGLNLLADFQPDFIKLDMNLVRGIAADGPRQSIVRAIMSVCLDLGIEVIAEGVETEDEYRWFADAGIRLFQGYFFAAPGFKCLPPVVYPDLLSRSA